MGLVWRKRLSKNSFKKQNIVWFQPLKREELMFFSISYISCLLLIWSLLRDVVTSSGSQLNPLQSGLCLSDDTAELASALLTHPSHFMTCMPLGCMTSSGDNGSQRHQCCWQLRPGWIRKSEVRERWRLWPERLLEIIRLGLFLEIKRRGNANEMDQHIWNKWENKCFVKGKSPKFSAPFQGGVCLHTSAAVDLCWESCLTNHESCRKM